METSRDDDLNLELVLHSPGSFLAPAVTQGLWLLELKVEETFSKSTRVAYTLGSGNGS